MTLNPATRWFVIVIVSLGLGLGGYYLYTILSNPFYTVTDQFIDSSGPQQVSVAFVQVAEYDTVKIKKTAELITREAHEDGRVDPTKPRTFLYHFFKSGDTLALTDADVDELAYTHPSIVDPQKQLVSVPEGWVVHATFAAGGKEPKELETHKTRFFMPRAGIRAKDLR